MQNRLSPSVASASPDALHDGLLRILEILFDDRDLRSTLREVHREAWRIVDARNFYVVLYDEASGLYVYPYSADESDADDAPHPLTGSLSDYVRRTGRPLLVREDDHVRLREENEIEVVGAPSAVWLGAPLNTAWGCIGVVSIQDYSDPGALDDNDLVTLSWIARAISVAVARSWHAEQRRSAEEIRLQEVLVSRDLALRASQEKSRFLANMSHELRTPLNAIVGYAELLQEEVEDSGQAQVMADLEAIRASARHLRELIDGVLDLTQVESGHLELAPSRFEVRELFDSVVAQVLPMVASQGNRLVRVGELAAGEVDTDRRTVFQALLNLVANACKFTKNGKIVLRARREDSHVPQLVLEVSDTGIGIDPAVLPTLFEPFTQVDTSTTRTHGGSGLGLAIARRMAERLGGTLDAGSVPGRGSTFVLRIPTVLPGIEGVPEPV
jgi:signal transduction histidine kinase